MIKNEQVLNQITDCGLVAVVRANSAEEAIKISDACLEGGCTGIELTFTVPGADKVIAALAEKYKNGEMMLGECSSLTKGAKTGDYAATTETAKKFITNIKAAQIQQSLQQLLTISILIRFLTVLTGSISQVSHRLFQMLQQSLQSLLVRRQRLTA